MILPPELLTELKENHTCYAGFLEEVYCPCEKWNETDDPNYPTYTDHILKLIKEWK